MGGAYCVYIFLIGNASGSVKLRHPELLRCKGNAMRLHPSVMPLLSRGKLQPVKGCKKLVQP
eukprot:scaffold38850_cov15-Tisochrysis_lutea.AAC.1